MGRFKFVSVEGTVVSDWSPAMTRRAFVVASACLGASALMGCGSSGGSPATVEAPSSPYDWSGLVREGEKLSYYEDDQLRSRWGIDVSEHQGSDIDWSAVADAGVQFVFVRVGNRGATEGALGTDERFQQNATGAAEAALEVGAYFFSQALTEDEAREEANFTVARLSEAESAGVEFTYVAYDHEAVDIEGARANDLSSEQFTANAAAFCDVIARAGYKPMLYGNPLDLSRLSADIRSKYPVWYAEYGVDVPTLPLDFAIWQYSNTGTVPGIPTDVDLNIWFETK